MSGPKSMQLLRERRGGVPKALMECSREQARIRQKIFDVLKNGPMTVPEIHAATGLPPDKVLWYLMAWKKYGKVLEGELCEEYYQYKLAKSGGK
jgi:hypothetical protein